MRQYSVCIDMFALLYSKLSYDVEMVHKCIIDQYNDALQRKLIERGKEYTTVRTEFYDAPQHVFNILNDSKGNCYAVLSPRYINGENLEAIWNQHLIYQSADLITVSMDLELLAILGISDPTKILNFLSKVKFELPRNMVLKKYL